MSKLSRPQDLLDHAHESGPARRPDWCPGCGLYPAVNDGEHRADCTATPRCTDCGCPLSRCKPLWAEQRKCCPDCHHPEGER